MRSIAVDLSKLGAHDGKVKRRGKNDSGHSRGLRAEGGNRCVETGRWQHRDGSGAGKAGLNAEGSGEEGSTEEEVEGGGSGWI